MLFGGGIVSEIHVDRIANAPVKRIGHLDINRRAHGRKGRGSVQADRGENRKIVIEGVADIKGGLSFGSIGIAPRIDGEIAISARSETIARIRKEIAGRRGLNRVLEINVAILHHPHFGRIGIARARGSEIVGELIALLGKG